MPRRPKIDPVETAAGWMVSIPPSLNADNKRKRHFFPSKSAAETFAKKHRSIYHKGERRTLLTPEQGIQAAEALRLLEPTGLTLLEAARAAVARWEASQSSETFRERYHAFSDRMQPHWRPAYASRMAMIPRWVPESFMKARIHEIDEKAMRAALLAGGAISEATLAMRLARVKSVVSGKGGKRRAKRIALLSRDQFAKLRWHSRKDPATRRAVGLLLFAGVRPDAEDGEITRLDWSSAKQREIYIDHDVSKTGTDRHIPVTKRLKWWIRDHPKDGPVRPANWKRKWQALRKASGIGSEADLTRHTFASHFLAVFGDHATKQAMGHTADSDTLFRHYRKAVTERDGKRYFGL